MLRKDLINLIKKYFGNEEKATQYISNFTDEEIFNEGNLIISEIEEDFRFCANYNHLQNCGY